MQWRDLLRLDLGALLAGRVVVTPRAKKPEAEVESDRSLLAEILDGTTRVLLSPALLFRRVRRTGRDLALAHLTDQLARIVACNAPLVPALDALAYDSPNSRILVALLNLRDGLEQGLTLSEAMRGQPRFFPRYYCDLVEAGENTGSLHAVLTDLALGLAEAAQAAGRVRAMLLYLVMVLVICGTITAFIAIKILPVFAEMAADFGFDLPWTVKKLVSFVDLVLWQSQVVWVGAWALVLVGAVFLWRGRRHPTIVQVRTRVALALPFFRRVLIQTNLARASRILERLVAAGYPLDEALESTAEADINPIYTEALARMSDQVRHGKTLQQALEIEGRLFPASFRGIVSVGESSGRLAQWLGRAAHFYERRTHKMVHIAVSTVFPVCIVALGCGVMVVYSSVFLVMIGLIDGILASM